MKLQILIPQYHETDEILKPLLDSIAIQQNVDFKEIGVIIANDGSDVKLSKDFLGYYPFEILYLDTEPHRGVSGARNACLDRATADYVMFCDADDMLYNACGLWIVMREMAMEFDTLTSMFIEETRMPTTKEVIYINHEMDSTFVHGKVHRLKYLQDNNIRWNDDLTIHEDSYFNCLCLKLASPDRAKYCPTPFYLWKWRAESVCRHDPKYILKTYNNMLDSSTALVNEFINRGKLSEAQFYASGMIYDAYFNLNKKEWIDQENQQYRRDTEKRFAKYYGDFKMLFKSLSETDRMLLVQGIKNRMFSEGLLMESITFDDWIKHIEEEMS